MRPPNTGPLLLERLGGDRIREVNARVSGDRLDIRITVVVLITIVPRGRTGRVPKVKPGLPGRGLWLIGTTSRRSPLVSFSNPCHNEDVGET